MNQTFGNEAIITAKNEKQATCLHRAAAHDHPDVITLLFKNGADLDLEDTRKDTPLRRAIRKKKYSAIKTLIMLGASLEKAEEGTYLPDQFNSGLEDDETQNAIAEGQGRGERQLHFFFLKEHSLKEHQGLKSLKN